MARASLIVSSIFLTSVLIPMTANARNREKPGTPHHASRTSSHSRNSASIKGAAGGVNKVGAPIKKGKYGKATPYNTNGVDSSSEKSALSARAQFMEDSGFPHGKKGYVVKYIVPLSQGGPDVPGNMEWSPVGQSAKY